MSLSQYVFKINVFNKLKKKDNVSNDWKDVTVQWIIMLTFQHGTNTCTSIQSITFTIFSFFCLFEGAYYKNKN